MKNTVTNTINNLTTNIAKKIIFTTVVTFIIVLNSSFSVKNYSADNNCVKQSKLSTVLTVEELDKILKEESNLPEAPFIGKSFLGFTQAVGFKESRNRYHITNKFGYLGKYQFGKSTLRRLKVRNIENFLHNPKQQEKAFKALCSLNKHILRKDIKRSVGKKINGVLITESGILAAAHLGGAGNVKKYLRSGGIENKSDQFGSSIETYMKKFSGYDVSSIQAIKNATI